MKLKKIEMNITAISEIKIGGKIYSLEIDSGPRVLESQHVGRIIHSEGKIKIAHQHPDQFRDTLWHELFHAIFTIAGREKDRDDESLVSTLAHFVDSILIDNPGLMKLYDNKKHEVKNA